MFEQDMILDRYRVIGRAGAGGYGTVQHAFDTRLKRDVAIKCIRLSQADIARVQSNNYSDDAPYHAVQSPVQVRAIGSLSKNRNRRPQTRSMYSQRSFAGSFLPAALPSEPGFLNKRDEIASRRASYAPHSIREARSLANEGRLRTPAHTTAFAPRGHSDSASDDEIYALAEILPGRIAGAGETQISSVDDAAVDVSYEFEEEFRSYEADQISQPVFAEDDEQFTTVIPVPAFLKAGKRGNTIAFTSASSKGRSRSSAGNSGHRSYRSHRSYDPIERDERASRYDRVSYDDASSRSRTRSRNASSSGAYASYDSYGTPLPSRPRSEYDLDNVPGLEEARTAAHLNDANIVTVYDCVVEGGMAYVIMEYVEGKTLASLLSQLQNDITLDMIAAIFSSVAHALEVAHKANVLHLDIKPENVIVNKDGVVKVMDFGLSTLMDAGGHGSTGGGTIGYMPLEQMRQQALDVRTDEWALASLTYEMLSGTNPFRARTLPEAEKAIINAELVLPSKCWDEMDEKIDDVMFSALDPDQDERYKTINSFSKKLLPMLGNVKEGKKQLATVVTEAEETETKDNGEFLEKLPPLIDRLGSTGSGLIMRAFAALSAVMISAIALLNFRLDFSGGATGAYPDTTFGVFSTAPIAAWIVLALLTVITTLRPRFGLPVLLVAFGLALAFNQAWLTAAIFVIGIGAWWWIYGRIDDTACTLVLMEPLLGSFGFGAVVPVASGALMDIKEAALTSVAAVLSAITFASLGSTNLMNWDVMSNFIVAINPQISGASITNALVAMLASPITWIVALSWIVSAFAFSLFCRRGTRTFDIVGAIVCSAILIAGTIVIPAMMVEQAQFDPLAVAGIVVACLVAVAFAVFGVTDRVRLVEGDALDPVEDGVDPS